MQKAVNKAYISGRKLEQYKRERELQQQLQVHNEGGLAVIHESLMEDSNADLGQALKNVADVEMKEEAKRTIKKQMLEEENASDDSGEGVDSDDLDDEIEDNVEQLVMQQQNFMPLQQQVP